MEAAQQHTGWPIGRKTRQESGGRLGATPENTGMLGQTEATCSKDSWVALQLQSAQPPAQGKATNEGKGERKATPASEGATKNATAQPAPAQELAKASRQASNNHHTGGKASP